MSYLCYLCLLVYSGTFVLYPTRLRMETQRPQQDMNPTTNNCGSTVTIIVWYLDLQLYVHSVQSMLWCPLRFSNVWFVFFSVVCFVYLCIGFNGTFNNISAIS
jgi:hypothetical protein